MVSSKVQYRFSSAIFLATAAYSSGDTSRASGIMSPEAASPACAYGWREIALEGKEHLDLFDGIWQCVIHIRHNPDRVRTQSFFVCRLSAFSTKPPVLDLILLGLAEFCTAPPSRRFCCVVDMRSRKSSSSISVRFQRLSIRELPVQSLIFNCFPSCGKEFYISCGSLTEALLP